MSNSVLLIRYYQEAGPLYKSNIITKYLNISNLVRKIKSFFEFLDLFIW